MPEKDHLALALTRSVLFMGVPMHLFFGNVMLGTLICIDAHTFFGVPFAFIMHLFLFKFTLKDPIFFKLLLKAWIKAPPGFNFFYWGKTNSYIAW